MDLACHQHAVSGHCLPTQKWLVSQSEICVQCVNAEIVYSTGKTCYMRAVACLK